MNAILLLPASLRIVIFLFRMVVLGLLLYSISYVALSKKKRQALVYLASLSVAVFVMILTRTPLLYGLNPTLGDALNLIMLLPLGDSIYRFVKTKRIILLFDALYFAFNVTYLSFIPYYGHIAEASFGYLFVRTVFMHFRTIEDNRRERGVLAIKDALDELRDGVFFHSFGKITYINESMKNILARMGLSSFESTDRIINEISTKGRPISESVYILTLGPSHYRFYLGEEQVSCIDVTALEELVLEEENTSIILNERNKLLKAQLDELIEVQNENEVLNLKSHIHDNLAQQLSILHMFLINGEVTDIGKVKEILSGLELTPSNEGNTISDLQDTFASIGVNIHIEGETPSDRDRYSLYYDAIKECTTNAIKHGFAKDVYVKITDSGIRIFNASTPEKNIRFGNGLTGLSQKAENIGGKLSASTEDGFAITIAFA